MSLQIGTDHSTKLPSSIITIMDMIETSGAVTMDRLLNSDGNQFTHKYALKCLINGGILTEVYEDVFIINTKQQKG